ncbi:DNA-processing protein DprA [Nitratiruptor tergarcus]|uniref:Predicted Rossmann fold nucleotide-binding protein involved in DNA uptake n=1 Tax=Nitratiruptor tergarcus DSM 16512 TaxID=1069081 RepID=A0A1W1WQB6_9BACT|nr:DNA-processing protein DprA [Nitratiruptor tergarcus]SMC08405.1 Predicted Rossmann fold nucleotide-binding protein involved in DNA uptake [Nitratiruptor tergarcus DSM 16512]
MKIAITGHVNIEKANGKKLIDYRKYDEEVFEKVYEEIALMMEKVFEDLHIEKNDVVLISGMARGVDEIFALYAMNNGLPLFAAIPHKIYWHKARKESAIRYDEILEYAKKSAGFQEISKNYKNIGSSFFARNQFMVDMADIVISYMKYNSPGTMDTIKRAKEAGKYYGNVLDLITK